MYICLFKTLRPGGSNEYPQSMFWIRNKKYCIPEFYYIKVALERVIFHGHVFLMGHLHGLSLARINGMLVSIRKTCPCNEYPLKPHFYIVKLGYAGAYLFLFLLQNIDCGYSLEPPRRGGSNMYPQSMF